MGASGLGSLREAARVCSIAPSGSDVSAATDANLAALRSVLFAFHETGPIRAGEPIDRLHATIVIVEQREQRAQRGHEHRRGRPMVERARDRGPRDGMAGIPAGVGSNLMQCHGGSRGFGRFRGTGDRLRPRVIGMTNPRAAISIQGNLRIGAMSFGPKKKGPADRSAEPFFSSDRLVEPWGIEPQTSTLRTSRSTN